jgi:hypothetical protein
LAVATGFGAFGTTRNVAGKCLVATRTTGDLSSRLRFPAVDQLRRSWCSTRMGSGVPFLLSLRSTMRWESSAPRRVKAAEVAPDRRRVYQRERSASRSTLPTAASGKSSLWVKVAVKDRAAARPVPPRATHRAIHRAVVAALLPARRRDHPQDHLRGVPREVDRRAA